jgi:hypothetical protein
MAASSSPKQTASTGLSKLLNETIAPSAASAQTAGVSNGALSRTVVVTGVSNQEFLEQYALPGRIGLSGGITLIDKAICRAERHLDLEEKWGSWSHAFLFQGQRFDGHHWVIESDLQFHRKHIQFGVQENRISKYCDEKLYTTLAVLDFGLTEKQIAAVLCEALELAANRARYSLRELFGTLIALKRKELRSQSNLLSRESSMYCSAFVQYLFRKAGLDLAPGVDPKNTTPEDIARTGIPHVKYVLERPVPLSKISKLKTVAVAKRIRERIRARGSGNGNQ